MLTSIQTWTTEQIWLCIGFVGQGLFTMRFLVQWLASEKKKKSVVPNAFWYFSLAGGFTLFYYALYRQDPVFIFGQGLGLLIYLRNLYFITYNKKRGETVDTSIEKRRFISLSKILKTGFENTVKFTKAERGFLFLIILCVGGFYFFAGFVGKILEEEGRALDKAFLIWLRDHANSQELSGPLWFHGMMHDFSVLGGMSSLMIVTIAAIIYLVVSEKYGQSLYVGITVGTGVFLGNLLNIGFNHSQIDLISHTSTAYTPFFPCRHSLITATVSLTLGALFAEAQPKVKLKIYILSIVLLLIVATGMSRIYLGSDWPSHVLVGSLTGFLWAFLARIINHKINQARKDLK